jgi:Domain of unknown function (DUF1735)
MKKIIAILAIISFFGCNKSDEITLSSSDKSTVMFTENGAATKSFPKFNYLPDASLVDEYISFDHYTIKAKLDGPITAPEDITITYAIDPAAVAKFNSDGAAADPNWKPFAMLPASNFSLVVTSDVIKKGEVYAPTVTNNILTHPGLIDPSKFYVIPVKISSSSYASGIGSGTIFFYIIGNPLAGVYQDWGVRYNLTGSVAWGGPAAGLGLATAPGVPSVGPPGGAPVTTVYNYLQTAVPVDGQTVNLVMGNVPDPAGGGALYYITADASFANITLDFSGTFKSGYSNIAKYIRGYVAPSATQKPAFRLVTHYNNTTGGAGNDRIIDETFIHQ